MPRLFYSIVVLLVASLVGCGLSDRERAVAAANDAIRAVEAASHVVADVIGALPDGDLDHADFGPLRDAISRYMETTEALNAAMRSLGEHIPELQDHVENIFRPSAEAAAASCQQALDALSTAESVAEDHQRAITRLGQCIERYATAVSNVKAAHDRTSG
jgi:hypothetical protein